MSHIIENKRLDGNKKINEKQSNAIVEDEEDDDGVVVESHEGMAGSTSLWNVGTSSSSSSSLLVRHAGKTLIRGKIRRIWRPRYLELLSNGLVRYYECCPQLGDGAVSQEKELLIPKCTLKIHSARIIDVTTLRDVHVGLPRGSFGFLISAQRRLLNQDPDHELEEQSCYPNRLEHSLHQLQRQQQLQPRDFLCAVTTLEQAQAWVVALEWAAATCRRNGTDWEDGSSRRREDEDDDATILSSWTTPTTATTIRTTPSRKKKRRRKLAPSGKMVIAQVARIQFVRTDIFSFEVAHRIHVLIISDSTSSQQQKQQTLIEERVLLKSRGDWETLWTDLELEFTKSTSNALRLVHELKQKYNKCSTKSLQDYISSIPMMDSVLKAMAMNAKLCTSSALRKFWCLDQFVLIRWPLVQRHVSNAILSRTNGRPEEGDNATMREYVKSWLQQEQQQQQKQESSAMVAQTKWFYNCLVVARIEGSLYLWAILVFPVVWYFVPQGVFPSQGTTHIFGLILGFVLGRFYERRQQKPIEDVPQPTTGTQPQNVPPSTKSQEDHEDLSSVVEVQSSSTEEGDDEDDDDGEESADKLIPAEKVVGNLETATAHGDAKTVSSSSSQSWDGKKSLSSPLPQLSKEVTTSCWSKPPDSIFRVRSKTYLQDRVKIPSDPAPFFCLGVDLWLTDNPERHIARHPAMLGGRLHRQETDVLLVNFLLPFGNFVAYFGIPPLSSLEPRLANVWTKFLQGNQQYRDAHLKLLPVVVDGPWIVKAAVGNSSSPALLGKVIPLQYYFQSPSVSNRGMYEVDVIITASRIAKGILSVVKGHTKCLSIAFGFIIEAAEEEELPETVLCTFQMNSIHLEDCPALPDFNLDKDV